MMKFGRGRKRSIECFVWREINADILYFCIITIKFIVEE